MQTSNGYDKSSAIFPINVQWDFIASLLILRILPNSELLAKIKTSTKSLW